MDKDIENRLVPEIISSIREQGFEVKHSKFEGFVVETNKQKISIGIEKGRWCCESSGYLCSEDNPQDFMGSELLNIIRVDRSLIVREATLLDDLQSGDAIFIDLETSKGILQIVVYNSHNGYYGHDAVVISRELNLEMSL